MAKKNFEPNELFWTARTALSLSRAGVADIANTQSVLASCQHEPLTENYVGRIEQGRIGGGMCIERRTALCITLEVDDPAKIGLVAERRWPTRLAPARRRRDSSMVGDAARTLDDRHQMAVVKLPQVQEEDFEAEDALTPLERLFVLTDAEFTDDKIAGTDRMIAGFIQEYETRGPRELGPRVRRQRQRLSRGLAGFERPRHVAALYRQSAQLAGMLAYMAVNMGNFPLARAYCAEAFGLADFAEDTSLCAWVRGTESFCAYYEGDFRSAAGLASDGLRYEGKGPQAIRLLINGEARALAKLGDEPGTRLAIDGALSLTARHGVREGMSPCLSFGPYSEARTISNAVTALTSLGAREQVQEFLTELDPIVDASSSVWSKSLTRLDHGKVLLVGSKPEPEMAAELAVQALTISAERPITSVLTRAREVYIGAGALSTSDAVRRLRDVLAECVKM